MVLSSDLIKQFAKSTKDETKKTTEATVYGTVIQQSSGTHVRLDGTELLTPVETTAEISNGERVAVLLRNHTAMVMGNVSNPSASTRTVSGIRADVDNNGNKIEAMNNTVTAINNQVTAQGNNITLINNTIVSQGNTIVAQGNKIEVINNTIDAHGSQISTMNDTIVSQGNNLELLDNTITAQGNDIKIYNSSFQITDGVVTGIKGIDTDWITVCSLEAGFADIENLKADKLSVTDANIKYANIEFTNIGKAAMENFYAKSGLIKNVVVGDQTITGELVGVTIRGDLIEGNTIVADKLVVKGANGLYYKLNTDGVTTEAEQTDYNSLSGTIIRAKSVTAEKIAVEDLVAFGATIGGFNITENSIYSGVKETVNNGTRGIYLDNTGQIGFGDSINYVKFYKDQNGNYKLAISAESMVLSSSSVNVAAAIDSVQSKADAAVIKTIEEFYLSSSPTTLSDGSWSPAQPVWRDGMYIWRRNKVTYGSGLIEYTPSETGVCITGNTGAQGIQGLQGEKGDQGIQGPKGDTGAQGNTSYFHIKYSDVENPTSSSDMKETPSTYIGTYVDYTSTDSTDPSAYTWARFQGIQGPKGDQGIPGIGTDGKTSYLHIAYANSQDGSSGFSVSDSVGKLYIGQYTDFTSTDSTDYKKYSWTKIKGDTGSAGNGVASTEITYQAGSSGTTAPTGTWYSSPPQTSASAPYMWTRTRLTYTNGSSSVSYSVGSTPEGIEIGGRNLLADTDIEYTCTKSSTSTYAHKVVVSGYDLNQLVGKTVTLSFYVHAPGSSQQSDGGGTGMSNRFGCHGVIMWKNSSTGAIKAEYPLICFNLVGTSNKRVSVKHTVNAPSGYDTITSFGISIQMTLKPADDNDSTWVLAKPKLEIGNKATDWTPAPEDVDSSISAVKTIATQASDKFNWLVKSGTSSTDFTLTDRTATLVANAINLKGLVTFDGLSSSAKSSIIDSVQVGGRNLVRNSDVLDNAFYGVGGYVGTETIVADTEAKSGKHIEFKCTTAGPGPHTPIFPKTTDKVGKVYTCSFWAKSSVNKSGTVGHECGGLTSVSLTTSWKKFTHTWTFTDNTYSSFTWYLNWKVDEILYVRDFKIEEGNKATDWTPAPEDVDSSISTAQSTADTANSTANAVNYTVDAGKSNWDSAYSWTNSNGSNMTSLLSMVKKWTNNAVSDTTTIQGGWIATNTITADKIAIGDFTNIAAAIQPAYASQNGWSIETKDNINYLKFGTSDYSGPKIKNFGVDELQINDEFYITFIGYSSATCKPTVYLRWVYTDHTFTDNVVSFTLTTSPSRYEGSLKITNGRSTTKTIKECTLFMAKGTESGVYWCMRDLVIRKKNKGNLIVDGAITADKLSVTSLSAISANLGSITAGSINIGSGKFVVTSAGALTATGATISGNITATSGSFTGTVNANEGTIGNIKISGNKISYDSIDSSYGTLAKFEISKSQLSYGCMIVKGNSIQIGRDQRNQTFTDGDDATRIYGDFLFQDYSNTMRRPIASVSGDKSRVGYMSSSVSNGVKIAGQWNVAGASFSVKTFTASSSDIRLKKNIRPTEVNALSVINQMGLYQFDWKRDGYHQKIGFVADYLEQQDEHLAIGGGYDEDGNMDEKVVNDFYLMGYAIKGIQELDTKVDTTTKSLEARINSLQYQLQQAFDKIAKQEKQINLLTQ